MATQEYVVHLPAELVKRFERRVPAPGRDAFVQQVLERALASDNGDDDQLYLLALAVERDEKLSAEMAEWDSTVSDGLEPALPARDE